MRISDWSSDVCSSDLRSWGTSGSVRRGASAMARASSRATHSPSFTVSPAAVQPDDSGTKEIGRAWRMERGWQDEWISVVAVSYKHKAISICDDIILYTML